MIAEQLAATIRASAVALAELYGGTCWVVDHDYMGLWRMHIGTSDRGARLLEAGAVSAWCDTVGAMRVALQVGPIEVYTYVREEEP